MPGGAQRELPLDVFFFKFTLCQGSNAGGFGWEGVSGCIGGGYFFLWDICILIFLMTTCSTWPGTGAVASPRLVSEHLFLTLMPLRPFPAQGICSQRRAARREPIPKWETPANTPWGARPPPSPPAWPCAGVQAWCLWCFVYSDSSVNGRNVSQDRE